MAFQVGVTSDLFDQRGEPTFGREPLQALDAVDWEKLPPGLRAITPEHAAAFVLSQLAGAAVASIAWAWLNPVRRGEAADG